MMFHKNIDIVEEVVKQGKKYAIGLVENVEWILCIRLL
jgi:hypothetical protein